MKKKYVSFRNPKLKFSLLLEKKALGVLAISFLVVCMSFILSIALGSVKISALDVIEVLFSYGENSHTVVIQSLRFPRASAAILVGVSLGISGAILQGLVRNPLASPDIIGITGGASFGAIMFMVFLRGFISIHWLPIAAICTAGIVSALTYILAWKNGVTSIRLVLIGVGISSLMAALTKMLIVKGDIYTVSQAYIWLSGSVYGTSWKQVLVLLPWSILLVPLSIVLTRHLNVHILGDEVAVAVGSTVQRQRFVLLFISVALAASAISIGGAIGFVGLIAPHIARKLVGVSYEYVLPIAGIIGALLVLLADLIGRTLFFPLDVPAGVFTSALGAPFFIYLLYKNRNY